MADNADSQKITEALYEHNLEITTKNKTLSLLEKLYQTSILTLSPEEMSKAISDTIRGDLNLEFAGILILNRESDSLVPLAFSKAERLVATLSSMGFLFKDIPITNITNHPLFKQVVYGNTSTMTDD